VAEGASDTDPRIEAMLLAGYRSMSPAEKIRRVQALNETVLQFAAAGIRREHPGIDDRELRLRLAVRWLGEETVRRVFGWSAPPGPR
jgi:hypothetical protein